LLTVLEGVVWKLIVNAGVVWDDYERVLQSNEKLLERRSWVCVIVKEV
jgi:hypothetical protein